VIELDMSVDAALRMIVTCGVVVPPHPQHPQVLKSEAGKSAA